ncbi:hypothetical protein BT96DRAFT_912842 [Gymnopus androsaceus JB14]|uniref:Uncharacterized protein n=1 Tax=Gymnopus androsaceus JB14 TaxID=1447944 RepID=A0A6A4IH95_9AGAR|nr:hypothetical protein BT96DRAFT_912842 [Gymnopus androsaceus JB14]
MNINQMLNLPRIPASESSLQKRKLDAITSDTDLITQSSSSRRRLRSASNKHRTASSQVKGSTANWKGSEPKPLSFQDIGRTVRALERTPNQSYSQVEPATHIRSKKHRNYSLTRPNSVLGLFSSKTPLARHLRVLSRHIRRCQNSEGTSSRVGGPDHSTDFQEVISLTRIPSIMDVYLDAKSPSIDYTEEVFLEIADRISALSPSWEEQIWHGRNATHSGNLTRHPDSFERSTATWSEGLDGIGLCRS